MTQLLLLMSVLVPFLLGLGLLFWRGGFRLLPLGALPALFAAVLLPVDSAMELPLLLLGSVWGLDGPGRIFLLLSGLLWLGSALYALGYLHKRRRRFGVFFLLAMSGNFGLIIAQELLSFYLFFALMSLASYGLVVHERSQAALRAGRIYIILVLLGEVLLFTALVMLVNASAGKLDFASVRSAAAQLAHADLLYLLLLGGLGIKAGLIGLHVWLPLAHPVAPIPASAVLSGAMIKAGLLGWLRLLPMGEVTLAGWGETIMLLGMLTAFYAALIGVLQRDPKVVLAYSSISQMGVMILGVGAGLLSPAAWPLLFMAVTLYALHHGLVKGALFLGVGMSVAASHRQRYWVGAGLLLAALAMAGAPWSGGMLVKDLLKSGLQSIESAGVYTDLLPWSALATSLLMLRFLYLVWSRQPNTGASGINDAMLTGWLLVLMGALFLSWGIWLTGADLVGEFKFAPLASLWPLGGALLIGGVFWRWRGNWPAVPAGDIVVPLEKLVIRLLAVISIVSNALNRWSGPPRWVRSYRLTALGSAEVWLTRWKSATGLFVLLVILLIVAGSVTGG
ncbi:complex I subunit 5 family protein [Thiohalophilus sp.]|uniref:complex I subunit 5 family protein n=1 Tax=Thiohalophilus sp. TaxID=3028392 RepID=UPI0039762127